MVARIGNRKHLRLMITHSPATASEPIGNFGGDIGRGHHPMMGIAAAGEKGRKVRVPRPLPCR